MSTDTMPNHKKFYDPTTAEYLNPKIKRRVAIVTGGNLGIGWFTALHLYLHGYVVYLAGRTESKVVQAIEDIKAEAEARVGKYDAEERSSRSLGELTYIHYDACDLESVKQCALQFGKSEPKLDILINNAGIMGAPYELTKDGYEIQYQVNVVAPFLFTLTLLPQLENASVNQTPRVITLASIGHNLAYKYFTPSKDMNKAPGFLYTWVRYAQAKTADILFMSKFAEVYPNILAFSVHPGVILGTELYNHAKNSHVYGIFARAGFGLFGKHIGVSNEEGALATLKAALDPQLLLRESGTYFETGGVVGNPSKHAKDQANIDDNWNENLRLLKEKGFDIDLHPKLHAT